MRVCILGLGYRAKFYIDEINKINDLKIIGALVHKESDKLIAKNNYNIDAYLSIDDIIKLNPDFIINTISKGDNTKMSKYLLDMGIKVLQETPLSININNIDEFIKYKGLYQIAEQYKYYPYFMHIKKLIKNIGKINEIIISYAHDYHAISIIRYLIGDVNKLTLVGNIFENEITKTIDRYNEYHDGSTKISKTKNILMEWNDVNIIYNFSSDEYRSTIRSPYIIIKGSRGEVINDICKYLDDNNDLNIINIDNYGIYDDNYAINIVLNKMIEFVNNNIEFYKLEDAIEDSKIANILNSFDNDFKIIEYKK